MTPKLCDIVLFHRRQSGLTRNQLADIAGVGRTVIYDKDFPPFFDGLLPEGILLEGLLKQRKIDKYDYFSQIVAVGNDLVGAVTVRENK